MRETEHTLLRTGNRPGAVAGGLAWLALCLLVSLWPGQALSEKLYKWKDRQGQTHITNHYPSKALRMEGSKVEIIDSSAQGSSTVVIKTDTMSEEQKRENTQRNKKYQEIKREKRQLEEEKSYLEAKVRKLKVNLRRLEKQLDSSESVADISGDDVAHRTKMDKTKSALAENSGRLRSVELRLLRLEQEAENLR